MRPRTVLVSLLAAAMLIATAGPAAAGSKHTPSGPKPGGAGIVWSDPGPVDVTGRIGSDGGKPDALRYVGDPAPKHFSDDYIHADPYITTSPETDPVNITGTLYLSNRKPDTVGVFGLVEQSALKAGQTARDSGALLYLWTKKDKSMRIGVSDGRPGPEIVQVFKEFPAAGVPDLLLVSFTIDGTVDPSTCADRTNIPPPTTGGCMTLELEGASVGDSYGTIKVAVDEEFLNGAVPGWEMFQGSDTSIDYDLVIDPARTAQAKSSAPKSKDDCKNDGWKNYWFDNQGQCIGWVKAHGGGHGHHPKRHRGGHGHHQASHRRGRRHAHVHHRRATHRGPMRHGDRCQW